jgi:hypothetical protein
LSAPTTAAAATSAAAAAPASNAAAASAAAYNYTIACAGGTPKATPTYSTQSRIVYGVTGNAQNSVWSQYQNDTPSSSTSWSATGWTAA